MVDDAPTLVHLSKVLHGLAENPALPASLVRRLVRYRRGFGHVATRADLTLDLIEEILASDHHWLLHSLALNGQLPNAVRMRPTAHADSAIRAALVVGAQGAPRELYERLIGDPDTRVRDYLAEHDDVPTNLLARLARLARDPDPKVRATLALVDAGTRGGPADPTHRPRRRGSRGCLLDLLRAVTASSAAPRPRDGTALRPGYPRRSRTPRAPDPGTGRTAGR
uniref:hypothetical protein n=1 Tax=Micromonospora acroterricola TaxID=2202421 RepID=UPI001F38DA3B|nr:hypothetical protein [Micromonospora acroterricola]